MPAKSRSSSRKKEAQESQVAPRRSRRDVSASNESKAAGTKRKGSPSTLPAAKRATSVQTSRKTSQSPVPNESPRRGRSTSKKGAVLNKPESRSASGQTGRVTRNNVQEAVLKKSSEGKTRGASKVVKPTTPSRSSADKKVKAVTPKPKAETPKQKAQPPTPKQRASTSRGRSTPSEKSKQSQKQVSKTPEPKSVTPKQRVSPKQKQQTPKTKSKSKAKKTIVKGNEVKKKQVEAVKSKRSRAPRADKADSGQEVEHAEEQSEEVKDDEEAKVETAQKETDSIQSPVVDKYTEDTDTLKAHDKQDVENISETANAATDNMPVDEIKKEEGNEKQENKQVCDDTEVVELQNQMKTPDHVEKDDENVEMDQDFDGIEQQVEEKCPDDGNLDEKTEIAAEESENIDEDRDVENCGQPVKVMENGRNAEDRSTERNQKLLDDSATVDQNDTNVGMEVNSEESSLDIHEGSGENDQVRNDISYSIEHGHEAQERTSDSGVADNMVTDEGTNSSGDHVILKNVTVVEDNIEIKDADVVEESSEGYAEEKDTEDYTEGKDEKDYTEEKDTEDCAEEKNTDDSTEEKDMEDHIEEKDAEDHTEEKGVEDYAEEKDAEDHTKEKDTKDYTEEKDTVDHTEEKDKEDYAEEKDTEDHTEEKDTKDYTEEMDIKDYTEEKDTVDHTEEKDMEDYAEEIDAEDHLEEKDTEHRNGESKDETCNDDIEEIEFVDQVDKYVENSPTKRKIDDVDVELEDSSPMKKIKISTEEEIQDVYSNSQEDIAKDYVVIDMSDVPEANSTEVQGSLPNPIFKRTFIPNPSFNGASDTSNQFSVVTYNMLADCHLFRNDYSFTEAKYLQPEYRLKKVIEELQYLDGDVVCLQEVDPQFFTDQLIPAMKSHGYEGVHKKREAEYFNEGEATFYKTSRFDVIETVTSSFSELLEKELEGIETPIQEAVKQYTDLPDVVIVTKLQCKKTGHTVTVGNVHIHWGEMKVPDAQCVQIASAVKQIVSNATGDNYPHIICGDFNSPPMSPGYLVARDGYPSGDETINALMKIEGLELTDGKRASLVNSLWPAFQHTSSSLRSVYCEAQGYEPEISSYNRVMCECVDYIFYSSMSLENVGVLQTASKQKIMETGGTPNCLFPSDHVSLKAVLSFK